MLLFSSIVKIIKYIITLNAFYYLHTTNINKAFSQDNAVSGQVANAGPSSPQVRIDATRVPTKSPDHYGKAQPVAVVASHDTDFHPAVR
mmetsp:Transcript_6631/g.10422  ORF Transcript_6631/g.10422 Transcript_6631/m.10422 type:complete len:89 (-) Transcript_6631:498-764(-)